MGKKGVDLAIVFGGKPKGAKGEPSDDDMDKGTDEEESDDEKQDEEVSPAFKAAYQEWDEAEDEDDKMAAMKRLIHTCVDEYGGQ